MKNIVDSVIARLKNKSKEEGYSTSTTVKSFLSGRIHQKTFRK